MGAFLYQHSLKIALFLSLSLSLSLAYPALAQSGCSGDPCVFTTPTPTPTRTPSPTPTPTPGPGTPTTTPTPTPMPGTATATINAPMPDPKPFEAPQYPKPTSLPLLTLPQPNPNGYAPTPLALPSPVSYSITPAPLLTTTMTSSSTITSTEQISGMVGTTQGWISDTISYTNWLSGEIEAITYTDTFTIVAAPEWYAPSLPRPMANVGWTFETMQSGIDDGKRYSLTAWASFTGYIASLPVQLIKAVFDLFRFLGAFGLFVAWLLIMLPLVLFFKIFEFLKGLVIRLFNFILDVIGFILQLIKLLPFV
ncbi:MAG: hypothetical protein BroJett011_61890 [Chloroflexota bacterium]|nr:MAG: hypothetical protein BroJett011_61890 [Chloroflexota bacterium]